MNKKILAIGSIIACIILLVASLSPVVGYNSARSSVKDSPLFSVRTSRAIKEDSNELTCEYVGKGNIFSIPKCNNQIETFLRAIDIISKMNDKSFNNILARVVHQLQYQKEIVDTKISEVLQALHFIRDDPDEIKHVVTQDVLGDETTEYITCFWFPGCNIYNFILNSIIILFLIILGFFTDRLSCNVETSCYCNILIRK